MLNGSTVFLSVDPHHWTLLALPPSPAGHETKALLNNSGPRYKRSQLERQMNCDVLWCVLLLICMSLFSAVGKSPGRITNEWTLLSSLQASLVGSPNSLGPAQYPKVKPTSFTDSDLRAVGPGTGDASIRGLGRVMLFSE